LHGRIPSGYIQRNARCKEAAMSKRSRATASVSLEDLAAAAQLCYLIFFEPSRGAGASRKRWTPLLALLCFLVAGVVVYAVWPRPPVNWENAARTQTGLAPAEVEAILGGPSRDQSGGALE
jgi:hypothetical protein